jgi:hypothetical protein
MKKLPIFGILVILITALLLSACGDKASNSDETPTVTRTRVPTRTATPLPTFTSTATSTEIIPTATPDPCSDENIEAEVAKVHKFMREFDDASVLAANMPREQLGTAIAGLQKIRRDAEDQLVPSCLFMLKTYQIAHMNTVINTLIAFLGGSEQDVIDQGIALARQQHDQYTLELARVLGLTVIPESDLLTPTATSTPY